MTDDLAQVDAVELAMRSIEQLLLVHNYEGQPSAAIALLALSLMVVHSVGASSSYTVASLTCKQNCVVRLAHAEALYQLQRHAECVR